MVYEDYNIDRLQYCNLSTSIAINNQSPAIIEPIGRIARRTAGPHIHMSYKIVAIVASDPSKLLQTFHKAI